MSSIHQRSGTGGMRRSLAAANDLAATAIDTALDRSIGPGYSRLGLLVRRRLAGWPAEPARMDGSVVAVTGAASGLGLAAAKSFARLGAVVHAVARNERRAAEAAAEIRAAVDGADARPVACDLSSLREVRALAEHLARGRLDVIVNNAGVMPEERERSSDGHELMFATHVLAPFALTALLRDVLGATARARVINVSSGGMYTQSIHPEDLEFEREDYSPPRAYARTKRQLVVITELWAQRLRSSGVVVHSMHPGWADTTGIQRALPGFRAAVRPIIRTADQGADTIVWLGAAPEPLRSTGKFWHDRRPRPTHYRFGAKPDSDDARRRLWRYCDQCIDVG
jgi:NAD(P)-dependent dehydrogenase (short-subunit alcohol dehydrogenase family)